MKPSRNDSKVPAKKPARWISPWSFDDEWEREYGRSFAARQAAAENPTREVARPKTETTPNTQLVSIFAQPPKTNSQTTSDSHSKSFENFGSFTEIRESTAAPTLSLPPRPPVFAEPAMAKVSEPLASTVKLAAQTRAEPAQTSLPALTPQRRPAAMPSKRIMQEEPDASWSRTIIVCLGMLAFVILAWVYLTDVKLSSDEDLRLQIPVDQTPTIAAPERLLTFLNAVMKIENTDEVRQPVWNWDPVIMDNFVKANSSNNVFDNLLDLLEDFDWHPHHAAWHFEDLGEHISWPHVRILLQARSVYLLRHGDEAAAFAAAIDIAEMSRRMQELWAWPSFMQRSQEMHLAAVQTLAELLRKTLLDSTTLRKYQNEFMQCEPSDSILQSAFRGFYIHEKSLLFGEKAGVPLDTLPRGVTQERPSRLFFKKNETLSLFADVFRQLRDEIVMPPFTILGPAPQIVSYNGRKHPFFFQPNDAGESYFAKRIENYTEIPTRHTLAKAQHYLVIALFATRCFIADQQRLPSGLSELKPSYLMEIPSDVFSGLPLCYNSLKGVIFSVGNDFRDDGGKITQPPLMDPTEPTVEIGINIATPIPQNE
jgi:hypothetical protein